MQVSHQLQRLKTAEVVGAKIKFADLADKSGRMKHHTLIFLLFVSLMTAFQCLNGAFELTNLRPSIQEGSCVELTVRSTRELPVQPFYWFWMKDADIILSSATQLRPVHPDFEGRVKSAGPPPLQWGTAGTSMTILMCDVKKSDSGKYKFAFGFTVGEDLELAEVSTSVTVEDNPCPIYISTIPDTLMDDRHVLLSCTTFTTCPSYPEFLDDLPFPMELIQLYRKTRFVNFMAKWQYDGKQIFCQVLNNTDKYLRKGYTFNIKYSTRNTSLMLSNTTSVIEGKNMTLICTSQGNPTPTFRWFKNDNVLPVVGPEWTIPSVTTEQNGKYRCVATNYYGTSESTLDIDVKYPPTVEVEHSRSTFRQGEVMTLTCNVMSSNPEPSDFIWYKDDKHVASNQVFTVLSVQPEHMGWYKCVAYNDAGNGASDLLIEVEYRPRNTTVSIVGSGSPLVEAGASVTLQCITDANPVPDKYAWLADECNQSSACLSENIGDRLLVSDVQPGNHVCYTCNATNKVDAGENSEPLCIQVLDGPTNLVLSMTTEVTEGELVSMLCSVESVPPSALNLTWTSSDQSMRVVARSHDDNTLFHSFKATCAHGGVYTCEAINSKGRQSTQKTLDVRYAPKDVVVKAHPSLEVTVNTPLKLECIADSNPSVKSVMWWKATDSTSDNLAESRTLTITSVTVADAGFYGCTVTNEVGSARSPKVEVKVQIRLLKYIIPPVCVLLFVVLLFIYRKRKCMRPRRQDTQNIFDTVRTSESRASNMGKKPIRNVELLSAGKDPSAAKVVQDGTPKDDAVHDALQRKDGDAVHTILEQQWSNEVTRYNKGTNKEDAVELYYAQVHFKPKCRRKCTGDRSDEDNKFGFSV
ncbi:B-cell receptor CD22-like [Phyllopteryx taeniolatus]|uniref:B-cell receptor CD22-like n=1 Tax=Phyllopteryx taeniolatus TaxID=161469 RepID=UPI002AD4E2E2|nr:B-cell receptor CD22-like [Phyllopteryx taeniolatus]